MPMMTQELLQPPIQDDRNVPLTQIMRTSKKSLIERLLEVQDYSTTKFRSFDWARRLVCLCIVEAPPRDGNVHSKPSLREVTVDLFEQRLPFVAVSYCCKPAEGESTASVKYQICGDASRVPRRTELRDTVLDRVIQFTKCCQINHFWVDEECLDKHDYDKKQEAINGMDILYRKCRRSVGLLTNPMNSVQDIQLLDHFLQGQFVKKHPTRRLVELAGDVNLGYLRRLMDMLWTICSDRWWQRCWIFQEGYCGKDMTLLMPSTVYNREHQQFRRVHCLDGDIQFQLRDFQTHTSLLYLAIHWQHRQATHPLWPQCCEILKRTRRYDVLHKYHGETLGTIKNTSMSASIIADIFSRDLQVKAEIPAIAANCCDYTRRIQLPPESADQFSLSLVVLALFLLNGDMLVPASVAGAEASQTVPEILTHSSFGQSVMPVGAQELTFLKRRRWSRVELCRDGLRTWGHIWKVDRRITIKRPPSGFHFDRPNSKYMLKPFERARLRQLVMSLVQDHPQLSCDIDRYLQEDTDGTQPRTQRINMMWVMAKKVCQAIKKGRPLFLGKSSDTDIYHAVFTSRRRDCERPFHVVTSWDAGRQIEATTNLRAVEKYVSLEVELVTGIAGDDEQWKPIDWVNGLCFFRGTGQQSVMLPWPAVLRA